MNHPLEINGFWRRHDLFWRPLVPCFGFLVTSPLGFKARVGSALFTFCGGECNVYSPRSTSGATHTELLVATMQPVTSPHASAEMGLGLDLHGQSPGQKTNALPLCERPGLEINVYRINLQYLRQLSDSWHQSKPHVFPETGSTCLHKQHGYWITMHLSITY